MRDIKTLLKLMKRKLIWYMLFEGCDGLCHVLGVMRGKALISDNEYMVLDKYMEARSPKNYICGYWWHPGEILPRYRFLSRLIREL